MGLVSFSQPSFFASFAASFTASTAAPLRIPARGLLRWLRLVAHPARTEVPRKPTSRAGRTTDLSVRRVSRRPSSFIVKSPLYGDSPAGVPSVNRLKIVREADSAVRRGAAGRMFISGRMADVCAELDRLVQSETPVAIKSQAPNPNTGPGVR